MEEIVKYEHIAMEKVWQFRRTYEPAHGRLWQPGKIKRTQTDFFLKPVEPTTSTGRLALPASTHA
jgi:hypothetical protein